MENISVSAAAQMSHLSERQFNRITKNNFGMSFHETITEYRIRAAKQLLTNTEISVEEISNSLGFNNKSTFYIAFKKKVGTTPAKYRESV